MPLQIETITNPNTDGRGPAIRMVPHDESSIAVRYDEYDLSPAFFVTLASEDVTVAEFGEVDDGMWFTLQTRDGEVTVTLGCKAFKFMNSLNAAFDEWIMS